MNGNQMCLEVEPQGESYMYMYGKKVVLKVHWKKGCSGNKIGMTQQNY